MSSMALALHLCTGDRALGQAADAALAEHAWHVVRFENVYHAAVHFCRQRQPAPRLVLIGLDWLAADEREIVRRARECWPETIIATYGVREPAAGDARASAHCRAAREMTLLIDGIEPGAARVAAVTSIPSAFAAKAPLRDGGNAPLPQGDVAADLAFFERTGDLESFLAGAGEPVAAWNGVAEPPVDVERGEPPGAVTVKPAGESATQPGEAPPDAAPREAAGERADAAEPPLELMGEGTILTREELTALLGDKE